MNREELSVGQEVMLATGYGRGRTERKATITKIARVWLWVQGDRPHDVHKLRIDTQADGSGYSYGARFWTIEQWERRKAESLADQYLNDQGITINRSSSWWNLKIELADLLKSIEKESK